MMTTTGLADETDQGIAEIDTLKENGLQIDDDVEVESEITVIEVKIVVASLQANQKVPNRARHPSLSLPERRLRLTRRRSA